MITFVERLEDAAEHISIAKKMLWQASKDPQLIDPEGQYAYRVELLAVTLDWLQGRIHEELKD